MSLLCTSLLPLLFLGFIPKFSLSVNVTNVTYLNLTDCLAFFALKVEVVNTKSQGAITLPPTHVLDVTKSKCGTGSSVMAVSYSNVRDIRRLDLSIEFSLNYQHWVVNTANITTECISNSTVCVGVSNGQLDLGWLTAVDGMSFKCTSPPLVTLVSSTVNPPPLALRFTWLQLADGWAYLNAKTTIKYGWYSIQDYRQYFLAYRLLQRRSAIPTNIIFHLLCKHPNCCSLRHTDGDSSFFRMRFETTTSLSSNSSGCWISIVSMVVATAICSLGCFQTLSESVQPLGASGGRFSAATDCTGFFTIGIWSTLIVSFLLIGILTYGLQMLMSIKPNELYDDPKVKMVQLGALN